MKLPDLSYMMTVAGVRYIQTRYEPAERRNPDGLVRELLTPWQRLSCNLRASVALKKLRTQPFYYYVLARTRYYDDVYRSAVASGITRIVNIGAGSDTRAYRFADELRNSHVQVLECDQPAATRMKEQAARRRWRPDNVAYLALDLNDDAWPGLKEWLKRGADKKTLIMLEGVSPYINTPAWGGFLKFLTETLPAGSRVAYDFKLPGINAQFGSSDRTLQPFRLTSEREQVIAYHAQWGYRVDALETSAELSRRLVPSFATLNAAPFEEDALVQLSLALSG